MRRYALWDDQWDRNEAFLTGRKRPVGVTAKDNRLFVAAVLARYRAEIPWRGLPKRFGDPAKVHTRLLAPVHYPFNRTSFYGPQSRRIRGNCRQ